jgi:hypothetical protein
MGIGFDHDHQRMNHQRMNHRQKTQKYRHWQQLGHEHD